MPLLLIFVSHSIYLLHVLWVVNLYGSFRMGKALSITEKASILAPVRP